MAGEGGGAIKGEDAKMYSLIIGVDREWYVRKQASRLCRVGPIGIL